jgi:hypothetical protein
LHAGGYILAYENDNVEEGDALLVTRLSKLTMIMEYPDATDTITMWIQQ